MNPRTGIAVIFSGIFLLGGSNAWASPGTEGAAFLEIPVGAGPAALGSAYSSLASDAYAPVYNPAGLGFLNGPELSAQYLSYLQSMNYDFASFVMPLRRSGETAMTRGIGGSIQYLGSGNIGGTDPSGMSTGNYSAYYAAYSLAYGQQLMDGVSVGFTGKAIQGKIADASATAYAADLGALYEVNRKLAFSTTLDNLGSGLKFVSQNDSLPMAVHVGAAYQFNPQFKSTVEGIYDKTGLASGRFGTEWDPLEAISLRAGYKSDTTKGLSAMAGLTAGVGIHAFGQEIAYAWLPYGELGDTQYISLLMHFGATERESRNLIQYQTIKQHRTVNSEDKDLDYDQLTQLLESSSLETAELKAEIPQP